MGMILHVNEIKLPEKDDFSKQFNYCSDLFKIWSECEEDSEEQTIAWNNYWHEKYRLETGSY